jgi:hypothetical protein
VASRKCFPGLSEQAPCGRREMPRSRVMVATEDPTREASPTTECVSIEFRTIGRPPNGTKTAPAERQTPEGVYQSD